MILSAATAAFLLPWQVAAVWTAAYTAWCFLPHGRWMTHNRHPRTEETRPASWFEKAVESVAGNNDYIALGIKNVIFSVLMIPAFFVGQFGLEEIIVLTAFPILSGLAYETGWQLNDRAKVKDPLEPAELLQGFALGVVLLIFAI